jgi:hypothetical protein
MGGPHVSERQRGDHDVGPIGGLIATLLALILLLLI